jgi:hypothetical protein
MKMYFILIACSILYCGCDKVSEDQFDKDDSSVLEKDSFSEGYYGGYFAFQDKNYWSLIVFSSNKYEEWPSGGAYYQKGMGCLTTGTFNINNSVLSFDLNSYKFPLFPTSCDSAMILPGDYKINLITIKDSLVFSKGVGKTKIKYHLKRILN